MAVEFPGLNLPLAISIFKIHRGIEFTGIEPSTQLVHSAAELIVASFSPRYSGSFRERLTAFGLGTGTIFKATILNFRPF